MTRLGATPLGIHAGARYRTVDEAEIIDTLLFYGWAYELRSSGRLAVTSEAKSVLDRWVDDGLPCATTRDGGRRFDPAEVMHFLKLSGLERGDPLWEARFVATGRRLVREFQRHGSVPNGRPAFDPPGPERFSVSLRRDFDLPRPQAGARVRLRLPLPLEEDALRDLTVEIVPPTNLAADFTIAPGRLDACFQASGDPRATLAVTTTFTALPIVPGASSARLDAASAELYTRPRENLLCVSPRIRALAAELAGSSRDPAVLVQRFWTFMLDRLKCGIVHYDELPAAQPADWVLDTGWCDCQLGSALFAGLCRASAIPARLVSGYLLYPAAPAYHYWSEVWLDGRGWVPFDLISWDLSVGGRDAAWRDWFCGRLDYRMKTQSMPRLFTGTPTIRFPRAWHLLPRLESDGASVGYVAIDSGTLIYRDYISVRRG